MPTIYLRMLDDTKTDYEKTGLLQTLYRSHDGLYTIFGTSSTTSGRRHGHVLSLKDVVMDTYHR